MNVQPFRVNIPKSALDDLQDRLARTRWPDDLPGVGWSYGVPLNIVQRLADYWRNGYDWGSDISLQVGRFDTEHVVGDVQKFFRSLRRQP